MPSVKGLDLTKGDLHPLAVSLDDLLAYARVREFFGEMGGKHPQIFYWGESIPSIVFANNHAWEVNVPHRRGYLK